MWNTGTYPKYCEFIRLCQFHEEKIVIFDASTASRACEYILQEPPYIDTELTKQRPEIGKILIDDLNTIVIPEQIAGRLNPLVADALRETLALLAYAKEHCELKLAEELLIATRCLNAEDDSINVYAHVYDDDYDAFNEVETQWLVIEEPGKLDEVNDLHTFWTNTEQAIEWAFNDLVSRKILDKEQHKLPPRKNWNVMKSFNKSIQDNHFDRQDILVRIFFTVVKVLVGFYPREANSKENHALQRDNAQIIRHFDGALAWRTYVSRSKPKIRLHYWLTSENYIDFSKIGLHNDYEIE
jgi:hypothetical protein